MPTERTRGLGTRTDGHGRAYAGSQLQIQLYSSRRPAQLSAALLQAFGRSDDRIEWLAPLEVEKFAEPLDEAFLDALGLSVHSGALKTFWPGIGPRWDGLARLKLSRSVLLIEGKSYPAELRGGGCQAKSQRSLELIDAALAETRRWLGVTTDSNWKGELYQYANRLAHVRFLRQLGVDAWLVNLCFVNDPTKSPTDERTWRKALAQAKQDLGLPSLSDVAVDVLLPGLPRSMWDSPAAG